MIQKKLPFTKGQVKEIIKFHPTPFYIYDEKEIRETAKRLNMAFSWNSQFKNYFAVKACPNNHILKILHEEGMGADCSSQPELIMADRVGIKGDQIMFTSNNTPAHEYKKARELGAIINLDDISHIPFLEKHAGIPDTICFRYNPGKLRGGNSIIGKPEEAKYGFTKKQLFEGYEIMKKKGVAKFGLHAMIASNERNPQYFVDTAQMLFDLIVEISKKVKIRFHFVNLGGGIGIPYKLDQKPVDLEYIGKGVHKAYIQTIVANDLQPLKIFMENGRMLTGPNGWLISTVLHKKSTHKKYVGLDACMANLMRPALYGAYHHITILGKENLPRRYKYDVTGSLCENNDKFAIDRMLPKIDIGDIVAIHDAGAHGYAMGFNYNGKLKSAELLLKEDGTIEQIRRAETVEDYFATLDFSKLEQDHSR